MFFWSFGNIEKGISGSELTQASTKASRNVDNGLPSSKLRLVDTPCLSAGWLSNFVPGIKTKFKDVSGEI